VQHSYLEQSRCQHRLQFVNRQHCRIADMSFSDATAIDLCKIEKKIWIV
jgi:hypothetical protein